MDTGKVEKTSSSSGRGEVVTGTSYGQILRSTAFTGGASVMSLALGILRTKAMAVLLGPAGVGLAGIYTTILGVAGTIAGMGISNSGVRQIAEAAGTGDALRISLTAQGLRRTTVVLGAAGAFLLAAASPAVSVVTFGDRSQVGAIASLGLGVLLGTVAAGETALMQGLRRIADLARLNVLGALAGTALGLPLVWWLRENGIVPMLVVVQAALVACAWWSSREAALVSAPVSWSQTATIARELLGLGLAFMAANLITAGVAWLVRVLVVRDLGLEAAGHYTSAYTLAGIYAGFLLQAMGTDLYPRLTAAARDPKTLNRLVNEQTEVALLMAVPGVLATLVLAPWVIHVFYSAGFEPATIVLQWQVVGILGRVISWPMGFMLLARARRGVFVATEILCNGAHLLLVWVGMTRFGLAGLGMAFAALYALHTGLMFAVSAQDTGFRWSAANQRILLHAIPVIAITLFLQINLPPPLALSAGGVVTLVAFGLCLRALIDRLPGHWVGRVRSLRTLWRHP